MEPVPLEETKPFDVKKTACLYFDTVTEPEHPFLNKEELKIAGDALKQIEKFCTDILIPDKTEDGKVDNPDDIHNRHALVYDLIMSLRKFIAVANTKGFISRVLHSATTFLSKLPVYRVRDPDIKDDCLIQSLVSCIDRIRLGNAKRGIYTGIRKKDPDKSFWIFWALIKDAFPYCFEEGLDYVQRYSLVDKDGSTATIGPGLGVKIDRHCDLIRGARLKFDPVDSNEIGKIFPIKWVISAPDKFSDGPDFVKVLYIHSLNEWVFIDPSPLPSCVHFLPSMYFYPNKKSKRGEYIEVLYTALSQNYREENFTMLESIDYTKWGFHLR